MSSFSKSQYFLVVVSVDSIIKDSEAQAHTARDRLADLLLSMDMNMNTQKLALETRPEEGAPPFLPPPLSTLIPS